MYPRKPILEAMQNAPDLFKETMASRLAAHERHARVTHSESAYQSAMKMARTLRAAMAHIESDDVDAVCADLSAYVIVSECAEYAVRMKQ